MAFQQSGPSEIGGGGQASPLPDLADIEQKAFRSKGLKLPINPPPHMSQQCCYHGLTQLPWKGVSAQQHGATSPTADISSLHGQHDRQ